MGVALSLLHAGAEGVTEGIEFDYSQQKKDPSPPGRGDEGLALARQQDCILKKVCALSHW